MENSNKDTNKEMNENPYEEMSNEELEMQREKKIDDVRKLKESYEQTFKKTSEKLNQEPRKDFVTKMIPRSDVQYGEYIICDHGCEEFLQVRAALIDEPIFELCYIDAKEFAKNLVDELTESDSFKRGLEEKKEMRRKREDREERKEREESSSNNYQQ